MTGIVVSIALLLACIAAYAWSERVARREGRAEKSNARLVVFLIVAGTVTAVASALYVWPRYVRWISTVTNETQINRDATYRAIKEHYPRLHAELVEGFVEGLSSGQDEASIVINAGLRIAAFVEERMPYASDAAASRFSAAVSAQLRELRAMDPELCYYLLHPDPSSGVIAATRLSEQARDDAKAAMVDVIQSSARDNAPPEAIDALPALESVLYPLELKYGADWQQLANATAPGVDKEKICTMTLELFEGILALPDEQKGKVLRYLYNLE